MKFDESTFVPVVLGLFGLGTTYLVWGPQELLGNPERSPAVDRANGVWGIWMAGFCQFVTGVLLFVGLTWFQVFTDPALYMAALAFSVYGIHWFALGWNRYQGNDPRPNAGMSVAFVVVSVLGLTVFYGVDGGWPVGVLFTLLTGVYIAEFFVSLGVGSSERLLGLVHTVTGLWLMYLVFATVLNIAAGHHLPAA